MTPPASAEVVVIGGGVVGTSIAFHLVEAGVAPVVLLERASLGAGSTSRAAGGVRAQFADELNIELALRSLEAYERFGKRPGAEIDLRQVGYLFLLDDPDDVESFERSIALQNAHGVPSRLLDPREATRLCPLLDAGGALAASWCPTDGHANPAAVVEGYAAAARALGAHLELGCEVMAIEVEHEEIRSVSTSAGTIRTGTVVCAAGPWSAEAAALVDVELPVEPSRREVRFTGALDSLPPRIPLTVDFSSGFYFHAEGPGLLFGMGHPEQEPGFGAPLPADWIERVTAVAERRVPRLLEAEIAGGWSGYYEVTPDHNALLGEAERVERFLYATGFSGHGFLQAPAVGEVVRDLVLGRTPFADVGPLASERFATAGPRPEHNVI